MGEIASSILNKNNLLYGEKNIGYKNEGPDCLEGKGNIGKININPAIITEKRNS